MNDAINKSIDALLSAVAGAAWFEWGAEARFLFEYWDRFRAYHGIHRDFCQNLDDYDGSAEFSRTSAMEHAAERKEIEA